MFYLCTRRSPWQYDVSGDFALGVFLSARFVCVLFPDVQFFTYTWFFSLAGASFTIALMWIICRGWLFARTCRSMELPLWILSAAAVIRRYSSGSAAADTYSSCCAPRYYAPFSMERLLYCSQRPIVRQSTAAFLIGIFFKGITPQACAFHSH